MPPFATHTHTHKTLQVLKSGFSGFLSQLIFVQNFEWEAAALRCWSPQCQCCPLTECSIILVLSFTYSNQYFLTLFEFRVCVRQLLRCVLSALDGEGKTTSINVEGWIYRTQKADLSEEQRKVNSSKKHGVKEPCWSFKYANTKTNVNRTGVQMNGWYNNCWLAYRISY